MLNNALEVATVVFAVVTGTAAGILALLSLEILRQSPVGRAMALFSFALVLFIIYHILLLFIGQSGPLISAITGLMYTAVAVAIWLIVLADLKIERNREETRTTS